MKTLKRVNGKSKQLMAVVKEATTVITALAALIVAALGLIGALAALDTANNKAD